MQRHYNVSTQCRAGSNPSKRSAVIGSWLIRMAYTVKTLEPCNVCGEQTYRRQNKTRLPLCLPCASEVMEANVHNMKSHHGPYYESWLAGMQRFATRWGGTTGGTPNDQDCPSTGPQATVG